MLPSIVFFQGVDSSGHGELWKTDGTAAGTFELTGIAGAASSGLYPVNLTVLNANEALFGGADASGRDGLWETDGTVAATHELTGISGAATGGAGLYPSNIVAYNGKALFTGYDAAGSVGLWVTDGTAAGTQELAVAGALTAPHGLLPAGLSPFGFVLYNGLAFFGGDDASGAVGLWETDGTAVGTKELTGIAGAATIGQGIGPPGILPSDLTVYNGLLLFGGNDVRGQTGLWVSDGTVSGTHELTGVAGAPTTGKGLDPSYLTVFNGHALFAGDDASGQLGLWETDGAADGTRELAGIAGAASTGLSPFGLTVLNGQVLFGGRDLGGQAGLWTTDGTVAGTHELTGIAGAQTKGSGLDPSNITVYNGEALFSGYDAGGKLALWETNGTAAGTHELTGIVGASTANFAPSDLIAIAIAGPVVTAGASVSYVAGAAPVTLDAGLSLADASAGSLSGATVSFSAGFVLGDALSVGSPQTGIVSQYNAATGVLTLSGAGSLAAYKAELDSVAYASASATTSSRTIAWSVNDGANASAPANSHVSVSRLPPVVTAGASVSYVAGAAPVALDAGLSLADAAAVNLSAATVSISAGFAQGDTLSVGSPQTGIVSQYNAATGVLSLSGAGSLAAYETELDSITYASANATTSSRTILWSVNDGVNASAPVTSHVAVTAAPPDPNAPAPDLNILWQNTSTGQASIWEMNGNTRIGGGAVSNLGPSWRGVGTGDFNGDGKSDILWQNTSTGQASIWEMDGNTRIGGGTVSNLGPSWRAVGTGDFNGDGKSDILWQNKSTGQVSIWEMDGAARIGGGAVSNLGPSWRAVGTGDFNGDGKSDILWQNTSTGQVSIWEMDGDARIRGGTVSNLGPSWRAVGTGDFNGDGKSDILWQNTSTGQVSIWEMDGNTRIGGGTVSNLGPSWRAVPPSGGGSDILFQNTSTGQVSVWDMDGAARIGGGAVSINPGSSWHALGVA